MVPVRFEELAVERSIESDVSIDAEPEVEVFETDVGADGEGGDEDVECEGCDEDVDDEAVVGGRDREEDVTFGDSKDDVEEEREALKVEGEDGCGEVVANAVLGDASSVAEDETSVVTIVSEDWKDGVDSEFISNAVDEGEEIADDDNGSRIEAGGDDKADDDEEEDDDANVSEEDVVSDRLFKSGAKVEE